MLDKEDAATVESVKAVLLHGDESITEVELRHACAMRAIGMILAQFEKFPVAKSDGYKLNTIRNILVALGEVTGVYKLDNLE